MSPDLKHCSADRIRELEEEVVGRLIALFVVGVAIVIVLSLIWDKLP